MTSVISDYPACDLSGDSVTVTGPGGDRTDVEFKAAVEQYLRELLSEENSWQNLGLNDSFYEAAQESFAFDNMGLTDALRDKLSGFGGLDDVGFTDAFKAGITDFDGMEKFGVAEAIKTTAGQFDGGEKLGIGGDFNETFRTTSTVTVSDPATGASIDVDRIDTVEFQNANGFTFKLIFNNL